MLFKDHKPEEKIISKAIIRLASPSELDIKMDELATILDLDYEKVDLLYQEKYFIKYNSKAYKRAILLLRIYENLFDWFGNDHKEARKWMRAKNSGLALKDQTPLEFIKGKQGLNFLNAYLEGMKEFS